MNQLNVDQGTISTLIHETHLLTWIEAFLIDRKAQNLAIGTLNFYRKKLRLFIEFCNSQAITHINQIDSNTIRYYLIWLESKGHNPGGCHAAYRTLKTFLRWWEQEVEPDNWNNPIKKVKAPKISIEPLEPVSPDIIKALLDTCPKKTFIGTRNKALILCLLDTGARASELLNINLLDINQITGEILIREGKGRKTRSVFVGMKTRKALRQYLLMRTDRQPALWITDDRNERLTYWGLKSMIKRQSKIAGVKTPELHAFRRQFALSCLRAGMDMFSLQKIMGHADLQILRRYLAQNNEDLHTAHVMASPVDRWRF